MKNKKFESLARKHLLAAMPSFVACGDLLVCRPLSMLLRGFCFEGSGYDKQSLTINAFVQPLYIPRSYLVLTFGIRPGCLTGIGPSWWTLTGENELDVMSGVSRFVKDEGVPFIDTWKSPQDFVEKGNPFSSCPDHHAVLEAVTYSAVLLDRSVAAYDAFERLKGVLESDDRFQSVEWLRQTLGQAKLLLDTYRRGHDSALALLNRWRAETLRDLKLTKYAAPPPISLE